MPILNLFKQRILFVIPLSVISVIVIIISFTKIHSLNDKKEQTFDKLNHLSSMISEINSLERDFFDYESINPSFYETSKSEVLDRSNLLFKELEYSLRDLNNRLLEREITQHINRLTQNIREHSNLYDSISFCIRHRGFKDYGLEGKMRKEIHFIENHSPFENLAGILMLRRHEKDYFLRKQSSYISKVEKQLNHLRQCVIDCKIDTIQKKIYTKSLDKYDYYFSEIVRYENIIGITRNSGLNAAITNHSKEIITTIDNIKTQIKTALNSRIYIISSLYTVSIIMLLSLLGLSFYSSRQLGVPMQKLTNSIRESVKNNFSPEHPIYYTQGNSEIARLSRDIQKMHEKIITYKQRLQRNHTEIQTQNQELHLQKNELDIALANIEEKNINLTSSINYAKRIQEAILPDKEKLDSIFKSHFVLYKPKDIVSGDYYWVTQKNQHKVIVAMDCTGHGVPGAFMTLLGGMLLNKYIKGDDNPQPKEILAKIDHNIRELLNQNKNGSHDGMDMAICVINDDTKKLLYAGAKMPLLYLCNNEILKIKATKRSVGGVIYMNTPEKEYEQHEIDLCSSSTLYLYSDGYQDQFGGMDNKKINRKKLEKTLETNSTLPLETQKLKLEKHLNEWMNPSKETAYEQTDDVMVIGVLV